MEFCKPYIEQARTSELIEILMPVYKSLSGTPGKIESFQEFCKPYLEGIGKLALEDLIEIYQAFKEEGERTVFMSTTYHWFHDVTPQTPGMLKAYLPFYRKDDRSRSFYKNWEPVFKATKQKHRDGLRGVILALQKIDRHLENEEERQSFIALFDKVKGNDSFLYRYGMKTLLSRIEKAYQVFTDQEKRERFLILEVDYGGGSPSTPEYLIRYVGH